MRITMQLRKGTKKLMMRVTNLINSWIDKKTANSQTKYNELSKINTSSFKLING